MAAGREDVRPLARGDAIPRWAAYRQEFGAVSTFLSAGGPTRLLPSFRAFIPLSHVSRRFRSWLQRLVRPSKSSIFSSEEDPIHPPNATGFNLQMAKHKAVAK